METKESKKGMSIFTIILIALVLAVLSFGVYFAIKGITNVKESNTDNAEETVKNSSNAAKDDSDKFELIAAQAEKRLSETFTTNYDEAFSVSYGYYATVDRGSIRYTNEYSDGDNYYVMHATVKNSSTDISIGKYLIRCKWDEKTNSIIEYGDNSRMMIVLKVYEEAIYKSSGDVGVFYIPKEEYKKAIMWNTEKINKDTFATVNELDKLMYYCYELSSVKSEKSFESFKSMHIGFLEKLFKVKKLDAYAVQIVTDNELQSSVDLLDYLDSELYLANDDNMNDLIEYSRDLGIFYETTLYLDK